MENKIQKAELLNKKNNKKKGLKLWKRRYLTSFSSPTFNSKDMKHNNTQIYVEQTKLVMDRIFLWSMNPIRI